MFRSYIIDRRYQRSFESPWVSTEDRAERLLTAQYKRLGLNPEDPNVFGSGIENDGNIEENEQ